MPGTSLLDPCPTRWFLEHLGHGLSSLPPGVAGVLVGHPFDTVKVSLSSFYPQAMVEVQTLEGGLQGRGGGIPLPGDHLRSPPRSSHRSEGRIRLLPDAQASSGLSSRPAGPFLLVCSSISQPGLNLEVHPGAWPPGTEELPRARGMHPVLTRRSPTASCRQGFRENYREVTHRPFP